MSRLSDRGLTALEADAFIERSSQAHTVKWRASAFRCLGGEETLLYADLPIVGGTLSLDSSDPTRRRLTLEVGGAGELVPDSPDDPLACFGQYIKLWGTIDRHDGSWFPWIKHGEFPIQTTTSEWPSLTQTVECADWSTLVDDYLHTKKQPYNHRSVRQALKEITEDAIPEKVFYITAEDDADTVQVEPHTVADAGSSRWETAVTIAAARGYETFFDYNGSLIIRDDITADENDVVPGVGPDIGTVSNPVAEIRDGEGGNLVALTASATREGCANGVFINLHETASQSLKIEGRPAAGDKRANVQVSALADGAIAWGDKYGRQPIVIEKPVKLITDDVVTRHTRRAKRMLNRRGGIVRSVDLDVVGGYWIEPDDRIRVKYGGRTEAMFVASVEFDLTGENPTRIRSRSMAVEDPG